MYWIYSFIIILDSIAKASSIKNNINISYSIIYSISTVQPSKAEETAGGKKLPAEAMAGTTRLRFDVRAVAPMNFSRRQKHPEDTKNTAGL